MRKQYDEEFKLLIVKQCLRENTSLKKVARQHGLESFMCGNCKLAAAWRAEKGTTLPCVLRLVWHSLRQQRGPR
ncbi:transposase [Halomonas sp. ISL-60]|uniref:transposase n=1 Tax=Halomonas sp. ISL-56 TaxID=2819149 RepID=UPI001BECB841|nr:transposase [Halomonas sp. ISL-60]MBT2801377.1 transposase [Halomonas sp. ISL-56]